MSGKQVWIDLEFADGTYTFALPEAQCRELEDKAGVGIFAIYGRILRGRHMIDGDVLAFAHDGASFLSDIRETVRLGLIGGGKGVAMGKQVIVTPMMAATLLSNYVLARPLVEGWSIAAAVLAARIVGIDPADTEPAEKSSKPRRSRKRKADAETASALIESAA